MIKTLQCERCDSKNSDAPVRIVWDIIMFGKPEQQVTSPVLFDAATVRKYLIEECGYAETINVMLHVPK